jgi:hypothetical protein
MIDPSLPDHGPPPVSNRLLREFAALWILFMGGFACVGYARERFTTAVIFAGLALAVGPVGLMWPQVIRPLYVFLTAITYPIGWVVSHVLLAVLYFGIFTPFAVAFRLVGRDVLGRRKRPGQSSYWTPKPAPVDVRSYFRQS